MFKPWSSSKKKEGKEWVIILPVVYDINNEIDNESFNDVVSIIRGLAANDERIIEYFKTKSPQEEEVIKLRRVTLCLK